MLGVSAREARVGLTVFSGGLLGFYSSQEAILMVFNLFALNSYRASGVRHWVWLGSKTPTLSAFVRGEAGNSVCRRALFPPAGWDCNPREAFRGARSTHEKWPHCHVYPLQGGNCVARGPGKPADVPCHRCAR